MVEYLLEKSAEKGIKTAVLTRGYKSSPPALPFLVHPDSDPKIAGDEPLLLAQKHPETSVLVDPKRSRAAEWAEKNIAPQLFLLDDGMQHLAIERDLNIVLLSPNDLQNGWNRVIPAGTWREDKTALGRADAFCMKADTAALPDIIPMAKKRLKELNCPLFFFDLHPTGLTRLTPYGEQQTGTVPDLGGSPYVLLCATGNPDHVQQTAKTLLGDDPADCLIMQDHHQYTEADADMARQKRLPIICTGKDAVKLRSLLPRFENLPLWVLNVRATFSVSLFTDITFDTWCEKKLRTFYK